MCTPGTNLKRTGERLPPRGPTRITQQPRDVGRAPVTQGWIRLWLSGPSRQYHVGRAADRHFDGVAFKKVDRVKILDDAHRCAAAP